MFLKEAPDFESEYIMEIPEGDYLCFKARILSDTWNPYFVKLFFSGKTKPPIVLANEYEDSLFEYSKSIYEIQMLIPMGKENAVMISTFKVCLTAKAVTHY